MKTNLDSVFWSVKIFQNNFQKNFQKLSQLWHCVTISNHKKVISIIEYLSHGRFQLGVSQSEASILIGLLIGVQEVKILFLTFCCSIPGHMTHQYDSSTFYGSYWWALSIEWIKKGVHHLRGVLNWFWFVLGFSQSVIENSIGNPTIESTFENVLMMILIGWPIRFLKIIFLYLAYSRNVLQPDLVVCNNSLQQ